MLDTVGSAAISRAFVSADGMHSGAAGLRALSSPCTMIMTPMVRVDRPQEFCHTSCLLRSSASKSMPNIFEKFCPRQWLVPPWMPLPVAGTNASTVVVKRAPANFSPSDLRPWACRPSQQLARTQSLWQVRLVTK